MKWNIANKLNLKLVILILTCSSWNTGPRSIHSATQRRKAMPVERWMKWQQMYMKVKFMQSLETWNHGWEESPNHTGRELFVHESCNLQIRAIDFCSSSKVVQKIPTPLTALQVHAWVESSFYLKTLGSIITIWKDDPGKKKTHCFQGLCLHAPVIDPRNSL